MENKDDKNHDIKFSNSAVDVKSDDNILDNKEEIVDPHQKAKEFLLKNLKVVKPETVKKIYKILSDKLISTYEMRNSNNIKNLVENIKEEVLNQYTLENDTLKKKVAFVGFLENFYDKSKFIYEEDVEEIFNSALEIIEDDQTLFGLVEDIY